MTHCCRLGKTPTERGSFSDDEVNRLVFLGEWRFSIDWQKMWRNTDLLCRKAMGLLQSIISGRFGNPTRQCLGCNFALLLRAGWRLVIDRMGWQHFCYVRHEAKRGWMCLHWILSRSLRTFQMIRLLALRGSCNSTILDLTSLTLWDQPNPSWKSL